MILVSIEMEGFRCFANPRRFDGFVPGINVLAGPNGSGKSTVLRAMRHALFDNYSVASVEAQAMRPWGRALNPRIAVVFRHEGKTWRIEKRFLSGSYSVLEIESGGLFQRHAEGKAADEQVRAMLSADAPAKGLATDAHLGYFQILWTPQGSTAIPALAPGVRNTIQQALGAAFTSPAAANIEALAAKEFDLYYSATGKPKNTLAKLDTDVSETADRLRQLTTRWEQTNRKRTRLVELQAAIGPDLARLNALNANIESLALSSEYNLLDQKFSNWNAEIRANGQLRESEARARQSLADTDAQTLGSVERLNAAREALQSLEPKQRQLAAIRDEGEAAKLWIAIPPAAHAFPENLEVPNSLSDLIRAAQRIFTDTAKLEAGRVRLVLEREGQMPEVLEGTPAVSKDIPGFGRVTAATANQDLQALAADLQRRLDGHQQRLRNLGVETLTELQALEAALPFIRQRRELLKRFPHWPPDIEKLREDYRTANTVLNNAKSALEAEWNAAQQAHLILTAQQSAAKANLENIQSQVQTSNGKLAQFGAATTLEALENQRRDAGLKLLGHPAPATEPAETLRRRRNELAERLKQMQEEAAELKGAIEEGIGDGLYGEISATEERLSNQETHRNVQLRRAQAAKLLRETLSLAKSELAEGLPEKLAEQATVYYRQIAGPAAPALVLNRHWHPESAVVPDAAPVFSELSGGEMEQVLFATRLALARYLSSGEQQLAVFDDSLLATDDARLAKVRNILESVAETMQVLVLTCHPEKWPYHVKSML